MHKHVDCNLPVTLLFGTVIIRRHLEGQMRAQTYLARTYQHHYTQHNTWWFDISSSFPIQIRFNTIQGASQHTCAEDGYLKRPHPPKALSICRKKLRSWKNFGLSGPFFWQKLGTWVLLSTVFVQEKVPSGQSKNIRHKTSDLRPSYLFTYDTYRTPLLM